MGFFNNTSCMVGCCDSRRCPCKQGPSSIGALISLSQPSSFLQLAVQMHVGPSYACMLAINPCPVGTRGEVPGLGASSVQTALFRAICSSWHTSSAYTYHRCWRKMQQAAGWAAVDELLDAASDQMGKKLVDTAVRCGRQARL